jgi:hypothetical protein
MLSWMEKQTGGHQGTVRYIRNARQIGSPTTTLALPSGFPHYTQTESISWGLRLDFRLLSLPARLSKTL